MQDWKKVLLAVDRFLGSGQPPTRFEVTLARHPVRTGVICGAVTATLVAWALSGSGDPVVLLQAALTGVGVGFFCWAVIRLSRWQHAYYERTGRFDVTRQKARQTQVETISPKTQVLLLAGGWMAISGIFWVISPLIDMPRSVVWSAFFGALLLGAAIAVEWIRKKRL